jgi:dTDP-4-dehydrorhamnose reductase
MIKKKIMILGARGMLGHMVYSYLKKNGYDIQIPKGRFDDKLFLESLLEFDGEYVINCIGSIPQKNNSFEVNYELPIWLLKNLNCRIIHPGTDCEMDSNSYGISKKKARDYILLEKGNTKIIKTSIIGPEIKDKCSLMEWFLKQDSPVYGFSNFIWNGNTTLEWSIQCRLLIENWDSYDFETVIEGECLSKFELLKKINEVFERNLEILPKNLDQETKKCIFGKIKSKPILDQIRDLKNYISSYDYLDSIDEINNKIYNDHDQLNR